MLCARFKQFPLFQNLKIYLFINNVYNTKYQKAYNKIIWLSVLIGYCTFVCYDFVF